MLSQQHTQRSKQSSAAAAKEKLQSISKEAQAYLASSDSAGVSDGSEGTSLVTQEVTVVLDTETKSSKDCLEPPAKRHRGAAKVRGKAKATGRPTGGAREAPLTKIADNESNNKGGEEAAAPVAGPSGTTAGTNEQPNTNKAKAMRYAICIGPALSHSTSMAVDWASKLFPLSIIHDLCTDRLAPLRL